jgi:hypothetical protein
LLPGSVIPATRAWSRLQEAGVSEPGYNPDPRQDDLSVVVRAKQDTGQAKQDTVRSNQDTAFFAESERSAGSVKNALALPSPTFMA